LPAGATHERGGGVRLLGRGAHRRTAGVAVQCLPYVVRRHPQAGRPRWRTPRSPLPPAPPRVARPGCPSRARPTPACRACSAVSARYAGTTPGPGLPRPPIAGHTPGSAWSQRTQGGFGSGGATVMPASSAISRANTSAQRLAMSGESPCNTSPPGRNSSACTASEPTPVTGVSGRAQGNPRPASQACAATHDTARPSSARALTTTSAPPGNRRPNTMETCRSWNSTPTGSLPR